MVLIPTTLAVSSIGVLLLPITVVMALFATPFLLIIGAIVKKVTQNSYHFLIIGIVVPLICAFGIVAVGPVVSAFYLLLLFAGDN